MINLKFVKLQFKNIKIPLIISSILFLIFIILALILKYFSPVADFKETYSKVIQNTNNSMSAADFTNYITYGLFGGFIIIFPYSIITTHILLTKEIKEGYFGCWLVLPMSRKTILNSKIFTLILSIIILTFGSLILQLILFSLVYEDFNQQNQINLVLTNFSFLLLWILWSSIVWIISCYFNKSTMILSILSLILILFVLFYTLYYVSQTLGAGNSNLENLKYFKFLTIISFFNSALKFGDIPDSSSVVIFVVGESLQPKCLDFCWQLPTMLILGTALFSLGNWIFIKKSLSL